MDSLQMFLQTYWYFFTILFFIRYCSCVNPQLLDVSTLAAASAVATWYGGPFSDGSEGGACGYLSDVGSPPFAKMISAGGPSLFKNGYGCGNCYDVKCLPSANPLCSGKSVHVVITDSCPGGDCSKDSVHFDLSGPAFNAMAIPGQADKLRGVGHVPVQYQRVKCNYHTNIVFTVDAGSNPFFFSTLVEYENTDSDIVSIELQDASSNWKPMQRQMSAKWKLNSPTPMKGPFSLRLKAGGKTIVAQNVIPAGRSNARYQSNVNF